LSEVAARDVSIIKTINERLLTPSDVVDAYVDSEIIDEELSSTVVKYFDLRKKLLFQLKIVFMVALLAGMPVAEAAIPNYCDQECMDDSYLELKQVQLRLNQDKISVLYAWYIMIINSAHSTVMYYFKEFMFQLFMTLAIILGSFVGLVIRLMLAYLNYRTVFPEACAVMEILFFLTMTYRFFRWILADKWRLISLKIDDSKGQVTMCVSNEECAMADSAFSPSKKRSVGCILLSKKTGECRRFAVFFRMGDYLITARHVAEAIAAGTDNAYATDVVENRNRNFFLNKKKLVKFEKDFFDEDNNLFSPTPSIDVFARKFDFTKAKLDLQLTKFKPSMYGLTVQSLGFNDDGLLQVSTGSTLKGSGNLELWHTASTLKGHSGGPLMSGNSVVGMHVKGCKKYNIALRIEALAYYLSLFAEGNESRKPDFELVHGVVRLKGRAAHFDDLHIEKSWEQYIDNNRRIALLRNTGHVEYGVEEPIDIGHGKRNIREPPVKGDWAYEDENAGAIEDSVEDCGAYYKLPSEAPVRSSKLKATPGPFSKIVTNEQLEKVGYIPNSEGWPSADPSMVTKSLINHLEKCYVKDLYVPEQNLLDRCENLVYERMKPARFFLSENYKSSENLQSIFASSRVKDNKSSGYPWVTQGLPLNENFLATYSLVDAAKITHEMWNDDVVAKIFTKWDPTPMRKLKVDMPRNVTGLGVNKLVQSVAVFEDFDQALQQKWMELPVKIPFAESQPGHLPHLAEWLGNGSVIHSDKSTWDYRYAAWIAKVVANVIKRLAVRSPSTSVETIAEWEKDVDLIVYQVFESKVFRCPDGTMIKPKAAGIILSGWFQTIGFNSLGQVVLNDLICILCGMSDEDILAIKMAVIGDDVLQSNMESVDLELYESYGQKLGIPIKLNVETSLSGCEFCSSTYQYNDRARTWSFKPTRISKMIENLKVCKEEDLAQSLISNMSNHYWNPKVFDLLYGVYTQLAEQNPLLYDLGALCDRQYLINKQFGYESARWR
jgi:hypothetical protein